MRFSSSIIKYTIFRLLRFQKTISSFFSWGTVHLSGKDGGRWIEFSTCSHSDAQRANEALNTYAFPGRKNLGYLFAFESRRAEVMATMAATATAAAGPDQGGAGGQGQQIIDATVTATTAPLYLYRKSRNAWSAWLLLLKTKTTRPS